MPVEMMPNVMEYFRDYGQESGVMVDIIIGVEHNEGSVKGIMIKNNVTGKLFAMSPREFQAIVTVLEQGEFTIGIEEDAVEIIVDEPNPLSI